MNLRPEVRLALTIFLPLALILLVGIVVGARYFAPPPPSEIRIAAGSADGAYFALAQRYKEDLSRHGIEVDVVETAGTLENYERLMSGDVDAALLQGGLAQEIHQETILTLGGMFPEPLWIFTPAGSEVSGFGDLASLSLGGGPQGSGTRALVSQLQTSWGGRWADIVPVGGANAANALRAGELDAAAFTASIEADYVTSMLADPDYELLPMLRANAISMRFPALAPVILHRGVVDLAADRPSEDVPLIAAIAQLGVSSDLHPAVQAVLLEAAEKVHRQGTLMSRPGQFPDPSLIDLPLSPEAERYYRDGPTFLRRYFPFAVANFLERAWVFLIPLATVLIPLVQLAPPVYRWRIRRKIYVWYDDLHELEIRGFSAETPEERQRVLDEVRKLQMEIGSVDVPASYNDELFRLRSHIDFIQALIRREQGEEQGDTAFIS